MCVAGPALDHKIESPQAFAAVDHFDPDERWIGNSIQVRLAEGTIVEKFSIDFSIGHRKRRNECVPVLLNKLLAASAGHLPAHKVQQILALTADPKRLDATPLYRLLDLLHLCRYCTVQAGLLY